LIWDYSETGYLIPVVKSLEAGINNDAYNIKNISDWVIYRTSTLVSKPFMNVFLSAIELPGSFLQPISVVGQDGGANPLMLGHHLPPVESTRHRFRPR
ncbi:MAG: hypothetical protein PVI36_00865, partial [Desulfobacterales bacterium]